MEKSAIKVGSVYEGSRGEARKVTNIVKSSDARAKHEQVAFVVVKEATGPGKRLHKGAQRTVAISTFSAWAKQAA